MTKRGSFNYRLSHARHLIECKFGILSSKCSVFQTPMQLSLENAELVIQACCILHNIVQDKEGIHLRKSSTWHSYSKAEYMQEDPTLLCVTKLSTTFYLHQEMFHGNINMCNAVQISIIVQKCPKMSYENYLVVLFAIFVFFIIF